MANRNENLEKINAELEKLTDEELDAVAGGILIEFAKILHTTSDANEPRNDEPNLTGRKPGVR